MKSDANSLHFTPNLTTARMCVKKGILGINFDQLSVRGCVHLRVQTCACMCCSGTVMYRARRFLHRQTDGRSVKISFCRSAELYLMGLEVPFLLPTASLVRAQVHGRWAAKISETSPQFLCPTALCAR